MPAPVWVILPTYDEAATLAPVVLGVLAAVPGARVLVVDDASPDGTGAIADALAAEQPGVEVLHRPGKAGLGAAYVAGFARAGAGAARRAVSPGGCAYARRVLGSAVRDLTSGIVRSGPRHRRFPVGLTQDTRSVGGPSDPH